MIKKITLVLGIGLLLVVVGCSSKAGLSGNAVAQKESSLGQCLTAKGVVMYGTEWCSHCKNQKKAFGADFTNVNYIDCDKNRAKCSAAGVRGYPTWKIAGNNYPGEQSLSKLKSLTGC